MEVGGGNRSDERDATEYRGEGTVKGGSSSAGNSLNGVGAGKVAGSDGMLREIPKRSF